MHHDGSASKENHQRPRPCHPSVGPCETDAEREGEQSPDLVGFSSPGARRRALEKHRNRPEKKNLSGDHQGDQAESEFQVQRSEDDVEAEEHGKQTSVDEVTPPHRSEEAPALCQSPVVYGERVQMH